MESENQNSIRELASNRRSFLKSTGTSLVAVKAAAFGAAGGSMSKASLAGSGQHENDSASPPIQYRLVRAEGTHRELGRQHGEQAAEQIKAHVDHLRSSRDQLQTQALQFKPLFQKHCPHLFDEITGLAEGAGISLAEALAVNIRGELSAKTFDPRVFQAGSGARSVSNDPRGLEQELRYLRRQRCHTGRRGHDGRTRDST